MPMASAPKFDRLRLIVKQRASYFLALLVSHRACDRTGFPVRCDDDLSVPYNFAVVLTNHLNRIVAGLLEGAAIRLTVARDRIIFAVQLAHPHAVRFFTGSI